MSRIFRWLLITALIFTLLLNTSKIHANASNHIISQVAGSISQIAYQDNLVYLAIGSRIHVLDISLLTSLGPIEKGQSDILDGYIYEIVVKGEYLYVASCPGGLSVIDIRDPGHLTVVESVPGCAFNLVIAGTDAFITNGYYQVQIIDVSDPANLVTKTTWDQDVYGLAIENSRLYVGGGASVDIYDVSSSNHVQRIGTFPTDMTPHTLLMVKGDLYVGNDMNGYHIYDVADATAVERVGQLDVHWTQSDVMLRDNYLYTANWGGGITIVDVTNQRAPQAMSTYQPGGYSNDVVIVGSYALIACDLAGICASNISDPSHPLFAGTFPIHPNSTVMDIARQGSLGYLVAGYGGLHIVDFSNRAQPAPIMNWYGASGPTMATNMTEVAVSGSIVFVGEKDPNQIRLLDVSDMKHPLPVATFQTEGTITTLSVFGNTLVYYDMGKRATVLLDFTNTGDMFIRSEIPSVTPPKSVNAVDVKAAGSRLYEVSEDGLRIFDISNLEKPQLLGSLTGGAGYRNRVDMAGNVAYLAIDGEGLKIVDLTDPQKPAVAGFLSNPSIVAVAVQDQAAHILDLEGYQIVNVSDPSDLYQEARRKLPGNFAGSLLLDGSYSWVNQAALGVTVISNAYTPIPRDPPTIRIFMPAIMHD